MKPKKEKMKIHIRAGQVPFGARTGGRKFPAPNPPYCHSYLPVQAEAEALKMAASIVIEHNLHSVCLESDCKSCIDGLLDSNTAVPWHIVNLVKEIKALVQCIPAASINWVPRRANMAAHTLARWSLEKDCMVFFYAFFVSPSVMSIILKEGIFDYWYVVLSLFFFFFFLIKIFLSAKKKTFYIVI